MQELSPKQSLFYKKWSDQRKNRLSYILYRGPLRWIAIGFLVLLVESGFSSANFSLQNFLLKILFFAVLGIIASYHHFKINEKTFQSYLDHDDKISLGIAQLEKNKEWEYENLQFRLGDEQILTIQNKLFWLDNEMPDPNQLEECMSTLQDDLLRLRENQKFATFIRYRQIHLQLFNNSDKTHPLKEKLLLPQG